MLRSPLLLVAACLLAACTVAPPAAEAPGEDAVPEVDTCSDDEVAAMDAQVAGQLDAIADRDWGAALGFATAAFRADHDDARFSQVISDGFPVVAANDSHRSDGCIRGGDAAQLLVTVTATDGATTELVYLMELEDDTWRIGGAVPHGADGDAPDTQVV